MTLQGIVENGQIRLPANIRLPENTIVYVVIPGAETPRIVRVSPRLAHPEQAADFTMVVTEAHDAGV
jgi:hypothetical protein